VATTAPSAPSTLARDRDDRELVSRAARGDHDAFAELYDRHAPGLLAFARQYVGDRAAAEDVVQQTFLAAYRVLRRGTRLRHPRAWLYHVARNAALTTVRDRGPVAVEASLSEALDDQAALVSEQAEQREELRELVRDMVALPAEQRAALTLFELGDLSQAEISRALEVRPEKVKALVFQARSSLLAHRQAREATCEAVRKRLATIQGGALNQRLIRHHLGYCAGCRAYREDLRYQRQKIALLLPVLPMPWLREAVVGLIGGGGGSAVAVGTVAAVKGSAHAARRVHWAAAGTATAATVAIVGWATWPSGATHRPTERAAAAPVVARPAPALTDPRQPAHRRAPAAHRRAPAAHRRAPAARAAPRAARPPAGARAPAPAVRVPVSLRTGSGPVTGPAPAPVAPSPAPRRRPPAHHPKLVAVTPPVPSAAPQPVPAPQPTAPPAPAPPPPASCTDTSHASPQGLANGHGHQECDD
jgi:RNA polymerase sigma factor (sigma-70 family)